MVCARTALALQSALATSVIAGGKFSHGRAASHMRVEHRLVTYARAVPGRTLWIETMSFGNPFVTHARAKQVVPRVVV